MKRIETETIDKLFLELSQVTRAQTAQEKEFASTLQAILTALNVGNIQSESAIHQHLREMMVEYREKIAERCRS